MEPITLDSLKKEKGFKPGKKHQKKLDTMRKKHTKERQTMQKNHCSAIEKLTKGKEYVFPRELDTALIALTAILIDRSVCQVRRRGLRNFAFHTFHTFSKNSLLQDANVKKVISEQTAQWSSMMEKQRKEEWELLKNQTQSSRDELKRLIEVVQATQVKQMQAKHDKFVPDVTLFGRNFIQT